MREWIESLTQNIKFESNNFIDINPTIKSYFSFKKIRISERDVHNETIDTHIELQCNEAEALKNSHIISGPNVYYHSKGSSSN